MPSLENLHQHFKNEKFILMAIDVGEKSETVQRFIKKHGYSFLNILDRDKMVSTQYGVRAHPMKFLLNKNGELIGVARGYREWDTVEIKALIQALIQGKS